MRLIKNIFLNPSEKRLRAGWRILIFIVLFILTSRILSKVSLSIVGDLDKTKSFYWVLRGFIVIIASTLVVFVVRRYLDKKTFLSLGLRLDSLALKDFFVGFLISGFMIGTVFIVFLMAGFLEISEIGWNSRGIHAVIEIVLWLFGIGLAVGWSEELAFRGYLLQNMKDGMGLFWAVIVSCILYGLLHMSNPNSTFLSAVIIAVFGFLRIFGWLRTGQLWLSMGMHASWDFLQGPIFGFPVSGMKTENLIKHTGSGPNWMTGGSFGPEAGIIVLPIIIMALIFMYLWTVKRKNIPWTIRKAT